MKWLGVICALAACASVADANALDDYVWAEDEVSHRRGESCFLSFLTPRNELQHYNWVDTGMSFDGRNEDGSITYTVRLSISQKFFFRKLF